MYPIPALSANVAFAADFSKPLTASVDGDAHLLAACCEPVRAARDAARQHDACTPTSLHLPRASGDAATIIICLWRARKCWPTCLLRGLSAATGCDTKPQARASPREHTLPSHAPRSCRAPRPLLCSHRRSPPQGSYLLLSSRREPPAQACARPRAPATHAHHASLPARTLLTARGALPRSAAEDGATAVE